MKTLLTPAVRGWLYTIAAAAVALLVGYKIVTGDLGMLWLALVSAILGLARANTPNQ